MNIEALKVFIKINNYGTTQVRKWVKLCSEVLKYIISKYFHPLIVIIRNQAIRSKNQTSEKCVSDHKSMLFFFQHHEEKSTFHDYYMEMITANFGDHSGPP